jgi:hypothetical protein
MHLIPVVKEPDQQMELELTRLTRVLELELVRVLVMELVRVMELVLLLLHPALGSLLLTLISRVEIGK